MKKPQISTLFYKNPYFHLIPHIRKNKLIWKDKYGTPRCELVPALTISWLWWKFRKDWGDDDYWEEWLWVFKYNDGDIQKAKESWPWQDIETKESTWVDYEFTLHTKTYDK